MNKIMIGIFTLVFLGTACPEDKPTAETVTPAAEPTSSGTTVTVPVTPTEASPATPQASPPSTEPTPVPQATTQN